MTGRVSAVVSIALHGVIVALLGTLVFSAPNDLMPDIGMEIEIVDVEHSMPTPEPLIAAAAEAVTSAADFKTEVAAITEVAVRAIEQPKQRFDSRIPSPRAQNVTLPRPTLGPGFVAPEVNISSPPAIDLELEDAEEASSASGAPAVPVRLDSSAIQRSVASAEPRREQSRINSASLGSAIGEAAPKGVSGLTARQRADLADMVRRQVIPCWNPPALADAPAASVTLRFSLDRAGNVVGNPQVSSRAGHQSAYTNLLANSGRRAILLCTPLSLPTELYDAWAEVEVEFDPRDLR